MNKSKELCIEISEKLYPEIARWLEVVNETEEEKKETIHQIAEAIEFTSYNDGYKIAKYLQDTFYYDSDERLVNILSNVGHYEWKIRRKIK